ncbi:MAG: prolyl oligopeptidase family serine peptidase, partial [Bacteroidota bacterium]
QVTWEQLSEDAGEYTGLTLSNDGQQAAFLTADPDDKDAQKPWQLHHWDLERETTLNLTKDNADWMPGGYRIAKDRVPRFSDEGDYLFIGTTPRRPERDTTLLDEEIADVEVWTTHDDRMYTEENVRLRTEERRTYLAAYRTAQQDFLQLGTEDRPYDYLASDLQGHYALVYDDRPYAKSTMWEGGPSARNTTLIDLRTGKRQVMLDGQVTPARWLQGGKFLVWYAPADTTWNSFDPATGQVHVLTTNETGTFYDEINDRPMHPYPYGTGGTLSGGDKFLVYDRYDIWELDPSGKTAARRITKGRESKTEIRIRNLGEFPSFIDPAKPQVVVTQRDDNYHGGIGLLNLQTGKLEMQQSGPYTYSDFLKARDTKAYVYSRSDFREYPDLRFTKNLGSAATKISHANPQQKDFAWGTNEIYEWVDNQGRKLRGMLVKPDGFNPNKKYPLLVNFYEKSSDGVFRHRTPVPGRSSVNYSHYVSKGYVIFNPDVYYREGYPGESAYDCVMSGVLNLLSHGYIDRERIGLQGHSWGGYQAAYLVTKTDLFAAVESGAPVVNMFSAYGGIRWGSGRSRQFQYEHTQSRIGGTPWSHFQRYVENSPLFTTDKINTPLLILHNDKDGAVPWYQGIEWFTALRRLGKPAWLLNYRNEPHWPVKTANRADFQTRMAQFFDYYLMDKAKPRWMDDGLKPIERAKGNSLLDR